MSEFDIKSLKGLTQDSRAVKHGYLFAALPGNKFDGRNFIGDAVLNGASVILAPDGTELPEGTKSSEVTLITDENPRHRLAKIAAEFYGVQPGRIVAVTGTNGKTTTVDFCAQLWRAAGHKAASLGTLGVRASGVARSGSMTTPDPVTLHADLSDMAAAGITHLAMEASSHGLDQSRLDGVKIKAGGFTNLTRDHLDYHPDMESYFKAKSRLFFDVMEEGGMAVLNADIEEYEELARIAQNANHDVISYGHKGEHLTILEATPGTHGQDLKLKIFGETVDVTLPLVGEFQVMNALCALGLVSAQGNHKDYIKHLSELTGVPGRLQLVSGHPEGAAVYIDYAHTPDALENILSALRTHTERQLHCLFGCGGSRDRGKRPVMGQVAAKLADQVIVTDDNPRSEDPAEIRKEIMAGAPRAREVSGRRKAIGAAIAALEKGDVLVIAGKGHEQGQVFADRTEPFDDFEEAKKAIEELC